MAADSYRQSRVNMATRGVVLRSTERQKGILSSLKLIFLMIVFSSWLLQIDGRFNPAISSVTKDTVGKSKVKTRLLYHNNDRDLT